MRWGLKISRDEADDYIEDMNDLFDDWNQNVTDELKAVFLEVNKNWGKIKYLIELNKELKANGFKNVPDLEGVKRQFSEAEKIYKRIDSVAAKWDDFVAEFDEKIDDFTDEDGNPINESIDHERIVESKHDGKADFSKMLMEKFGGL